MFKIAEKFKKQTNKKKPTQKPSKTKKLIACNLVYVWGVKKQSGFTCPKPKNGLGTQLRLANKDCLKTYSFRICLLWDIE